MLQSDYHLNMDNKIESFMILYTCVGGVNVFERIYEDKNQNKQLFNNGKKQKKNGLNNPYNDS